VSRRLLGGLALLAVAVGLAVYGGHQLLRVREMQREIAAMERDIVLLRARTERLTSTVERLRNDPAFLEKLAREDLGWVREGETVLKFPRQPR
jgi:cell division protein FtsB